MAAEMSCGDSKYDPMPPKYDSTTVGYTPPQPLVSPPAYEFQKGSHYQPSPPLGNAYYSAPPQYAPASPVVVYSQPQTTTTVRDRTATGDHFLILSIVMSVLCCLSFSWFSLFCTIPAIFFALSAQDAEARGDGNGMKRNRHVAIILNITAVVVFVVCVIVVASGSMRGSGGYHGY